MHKVLFVCIHNSARSQMAEAYLKKFGGTEFEVQSAGFEPTSINPLVVEAMLEEGIDLSARLSVYNLFNSQTVINVHSRYESTPGARMPHFGEGKNWQSPRYAQLVVTWNF